MFFIPLKLFLFSFLMQLIFWHSRHCLRSLKVFHILFYSIFFMFYFFHIKENNAFLYKVFCFHYNFSFSLQAKCYFSFLQTGFCFSSQCFFFFIMFSFHNNLLFTTKRFYTNKIYILTTNTLLHFPFSHNCFRFCQKKKKKKFKSTFYHSKQKNMLSGPT